MSNSAVFLDRDGVLVLDVGYPHKVSDVKLFPDVAPALRSIQEAGHLLLVVSNQSGVGRGLFSLDDVLKFHQALGEKLAQEGVQLNLEQFYVCPHSPADNCSCRKPKPSLLQKAAKAHAVDLTQSYLVGDKETDVQAGRSAGVQTIRMNRDREDVQTAANWVVSDLMEAADFILHAKVI